MIGILIIAHNGLADSLLDCVRHVLGDAPSNIKALSILADDDPLAKEGDARTLIAQLDTGKGVLLLSDLYGSTPSNIARRLCRPGRVESVSGVNLPMLLRVACNSSKPLQEVTSMAILTGRSCILPDNTEAGSCDVAAGN